MPKGVYPRKPRKTSKAAGKVVGRRRRKKALPLTMDEVRGMAKEFSQTKNGRTRTAVFDHQDGVWAEKKELTGAEVRRLRDKAAEIARDRAARANTQSTDGAKASVNSAMEWVGYDGKDMARAQDAILEMTGRKPMAEPTEKDKVLARALFSWRKEALETAAKNVTEAYDREFAISLVQAVRQGIINPGSRFIHMPRNELQAIVRVLERHGY